MGELGSPSLHVLCLPAGRRQTDLLHVISSGLLLPDMWEDRHLYYLPGASSNNKHSLVGIHSSHVASVPFSSSHSLASLLGTPEQDRPTTLGDIPSEPAPSQLTSPELFRTGEHLETDSNTFKHLRQFEPSSSS